MLRLSLFINDYIVIQFMLDEIKIMMCEDTKKSISINCFKKNKYIIKSIK